MSRIIKVDTSASYADKAGSYPRQYDGIRITFDDGEELFFGINTDQYCCETVAYLHSVDDPEEFIGANFLRLDERDTWPENVGEEEPEYWDGGGFQAIDVVTDRGIMQFVVYNEHNGYYSHGTILKFRDKLDYDRL